MVGSPKVFYAALWLACVVFFEARGRELLSDLPLSIHLYKGNDLSDLKEELDAELVVPRSPSDDSEWVLHYHERRNVPWSIEEEAVEYDFTNRLSLPRQVVEALLDRLSTHLNSDSFENKSPGLDESLFQASWHGFVDTEAEELIHLDKVSLGIVFSFLEETELNVPRPPKRLRIYFGVNDLIVLLSDEPVEKLHHYTQKKLDRVVDLSGGTGDERRVRLFFDQDNGEAVEALEGVVEFARPSLGELVDQEVWFVWSNHERKAFQGAGVAPLEITVEELLAKPNTYDGKRVRVSGYFTDGFEAQHLYGGASKYLWLGELSPIADKRTKKRAGKVTVEGVYFKGPSGHFGMSPGEITRITQISGWFVRDMIIAASSILILGALLFGYWLRARRRKG